jgi:phosphoserine aminotransferase
MGGDLAQICSMQVHNFSAGPCILPREVLEQAAAAVLDWNGSGLSLIEVSHRGKAFEAVMDESRALVKELLGLPDRFEVLFLQGGATLGFLTVAMNFLPEGGRAAYVDTGTWAAGAIKEARMVGQVDVVASSAASNHNHIPKGFAVPADAAYLHVTTNNTIFGTQYHPYPTASIPLIGDMSSDIFSRPFDASPYLCIYAGAQKNMGPAGTVVYIVDREALGKTGRKLPTYLDLAQHIDKDSMLNTPPVFAVYTTLLMLRWMKAEGGVPAMEARNRAKAQLLYGEIDRNPRFVGHAVPEDRSWMNATFTLAQPEDAAAFDAAWKEAGINGIAGHRSVGGYRASMYNALPLESVQTLVNVMATF